MQFASISLPVYLRTYTTQILTPADTINYNLQFHVHCTYIHIFTYTYLHAVIASKSQLNSTVAL